MRSEKVENMKLIHAVYERGVFRPTEPVELPDGCRVEFEPRVSDQLAHGNHFQDRIAELGKLKDGWLDGKGRAPSEASLDWLSQQFDDRYPEELPVPFAYPMAEGGVQLEWSLGDFEASLEVDLSARIATWHCLNLKTEEDRVQNLDLNADQGWDALANEVRGLIGVQQ